MAADNAENRYAIIDALLARRWFQILKNNLTDFAKGVLNESIRIDKILTMKKQSTTIRIELSDSEDPSDSSIVYSISENNIAIRYRKGARRAQYTHILHTDGRIKDITTTDRIAEGKFGPEWFKNTFELPDIDPELTKRELSPLTDHPTVITRLVHCDA
jgi:hypothetical protein